MNKGKFLVMGVLLTTLVLFLPDGTQNRKTEAQSNDEGCEDLMTEALQVVGSTCAEMGRNEACYGHFPVVSELSAESTGRFELNGDLVNVIEVQSLETEPADPETGDWGVALMLVQADLPEETDATMTFVLFGAGELTNAGEATISSPTCLVSNDGSNNLNIRSGPSTDDEIVETLAIGDNATATGRDESGTWLQVSHNDAVGWVFQSLVTSDCNLGELDVVEGSDVPPTRTTNAFTLSTVQSDTCESIPNGLMVHSPEGRRARVVINGVELVFSSVGYLTAEPDNEMTVQGIAGEIGVTVGEDTETVTPDFVSSVPLSGLTADGPPSTPEAVSDDDVIFALGAIDTMLVENSIGTRSCNAVPSANVNLRSGPGTEYRLTETIGENDEAVIVGTTVGTDGLDWWQLGDGSWVRSDLVGTAGLCESVPPVEPPAPPPTSAPSGPSASAGDVRITLTWNSAADLDLHVIDPNGEEIYFGYPRSSSAGELVLDDTDGFGPEVVFWQLGTAPSGTYRVIVHAYYSEGPASYQVTVVVDGQSQSFSGTINFDERVQVTSFTR